MIESSKFSILYVDDEVQSLKYFSRGFSKEFSVLVADGQVSREPAPALAQAAGLLQRIQKLMPQKGVAGHAERVPVAGRNILDLFEDPGLISHAVVPGSKPVLILNARGQTKTVAVWGV